MSRIGRALSAAGVVLTLVVLGAPASAYAGGGLQRCLDKAASHGGEPPTCTKVGGTWVASWPDGGSSGSGAGALVVVVLLGLVAGLGLLVWKVSTARRLASQSGMDPNLATQMTLLTDDGLESTYLAANLRPTPPPPASAPAPPRSAAERLTELRALLDQEMITQEEYDERRRAIVGSL